MYSNPVIVAHQLSAGDEALLRYWMQDRAVRHWSGQAIVRPGDLTRGLNFFPAAGERLLMDLAGWMVPVLVVARFHNEQERERMQAVLFEHGLAALWELPGPEQDVCFPGLDIPDTQAQVYLLEDDRCLRNLYRQILHFAGYSVRADFQSARDVRLCLEQDARADRYPAFILLNLDSGRVVPMELLGDLDGLFRQNPELRARTSLLVVKDFERPGLEFATVEHALRKHARRIFHPHEALLVLLEALLLHEAEGEPLIIPAAFRDLQELLYAPEANRLVTTAPPLFHTLRLRNRILPFVWLYDRLQKLGGQGATLTTTPSAWKQLDTT